MQTYLKVNDDEISIQLALQIDFMHDNKLYESTIDNILIRQYCKANGIENSDEELQVALDELRYNRNLESIEKAEYWINSNNLSLLGVQEGIEFMLLRNKMRNSFTLEEIEAHFNENKLNYDKVLLYSIRLSTEGKAEEIFAQITDEDLDFHTAAMEYSEDDETKLMGGYIGMMKRSDLSAEIEAAVFKGNEGDVVGPVQTDKGFNLFKIGKVLNAELDKEKDNIKFELFNAKLAQLKAEAKVTIPILED